MKYAVRLPANDILERDIAELLRRRVGRPSHKPVVRYKSFLYQAASWNEGRRVVAKVEFHFGELFPRVGFIVTNPTAESRVVVRFYNKRGTAEQWIKEGKQAVAMTRLCCHRFRANQVRLWLSVLAYNLGNLWRRLAAGADWQLVAYELAAAAGENRRPFAQARPLLLVVARGESPDAAAVCRYATEDRGVAGTGGIRRAQSGANFDDDARAKAKASVGTVRKKGTSGRCVPIRCETCPSGAAGNAVDQYG